MASGINSTFRQVGIATGIALLGTLFSSRVQAYVLDHVGGVPGLAGRGEELATAIRSGDLGSALGGLPASARGPAAQVATAAFAAGLNRILLVAAVIAIVSGVVALAAIRSQDFAHRQPARP